MEKLNRVLLKLSGEALAAIGSMSVLPSISTEKGRHSSVPNILGIEGP